MWRWGPSWQDTSPRGCPRPTRLVETGQGWLGDAAQRLEGPSWPSVRVYQAPTAWRVREHAARRSPALGVRSMPAVPTARAGPCLRPRPRSQGPPQGPWAPHAPGPPGQDPPAPGCSRTPSWPSCSHAGLSRRRPSSSVPSRLSAEARPRPPLLPSPLLCWNSAKQQTAAGTEPGAGTSCCSVPLGLPDGHVDGAPQPAQNFVLLEEGGGWPSRDFGGTGAPRVLKGRK